MSPAIQLWLPVLLMNPFKGSWARDIARAKRAWRDEQIIYMSPDYKDIYRFDVLVKEGNFRCKAMAMPSETYNTIDVINIDREGNYYPPMLHRIPQQWKGKIPHELFKEWLDDKLPFTCSPNENPTVNVPVDFSDINSGKIVFKNVPVKLETCLIPNKESGENSSEIQIKWPPENSPTKGTISFQAEMGEYCKPEEWSKDKGMLLWFKWPEPFNKMFPISGGVDSVFHYSLMKEAVKENDEKTISFWVDKFVSKIQVPTELAFILPKITEDYFSVYHSNEALIYLQEIFNFQISNLKEINKHEEYIKQLLRPVEVPLIFSWEGYFWWELSQKLEKTNSGICESCGKVIFGKKGKRFCSNEENPKCYKARRARDKRRERSINK